MKSHRILKNTAFASAILALFLVGCQQAEKAITSDVSIPVSVSEVKLKTIEQYVNTTGTVFPSKEATLTTEMDGFYHIKTNPATGKPYAIGDAVKEGATIIEIKDPDFENSIRIKSKKLDLEISKQELEKQTSLHEKGGATLRELKNAEINYINTNYDYESAILQLEDKYVKAPFAGVIVDMPYYTVGTKVKSGTEVVEVVNRNELYMEANLPEKFYSSIKKGMEVYVTNYSMPDDTLSGEITQVSPSIDPDGRTFKCFLRINNDQRLLLPGMFVKADLIVERHEDVIVIAKEIISGSNRKRSVFVSNKGYADQRFITTGLENLEEVEVVRGLSEGDQIIVKGFETLKNKSKIKIVE